MKCERLQTSEAFFEFESFLFVSEAIDVCLE